MLHDGRWLFMTQHAEANKIEFTREHSLLYKAIVVDGIGKSGKSVLLDILSGFSAVEKPQYNPLLEYMATAYQYEKISSDMAISILKTEMDNALYENMV